MFTISKSDFNGFLKNLLSDIDVFGTKETESKFFLEKIDYEKLSNGGFKVHDYRVCEPLKIFFLPPRQVVANYPDDILKNFKPKTRILACTKACDFKAFSVFDKVYLEQEITNPFYSILRENTIIMSSDCKDICDSCFCNLLGYSPYLEEGFDINLSDIGEEILVEVGSEKGQKIIDRDKGKFKKASGGAVKKRDEIREKVTKSLEDQNKEYMCTRDPREMIHTNLDKDSVWAQLAKTCVECSGCNDVCPTCYCFLLYDQKTEKGFEKVSSWDSCFRAGYTRMAGGLSPRLRLVHRFKNHYYHKFDSFLENYGMIACTGCGRCIDACMGAIDKRECMTKLCKTVTLK